MLFFSDLAKLASARRQAHLQRQTERFLESLPTELQKDIGWIRSTRAL